jgi:hypothetical protein
LLVLAPLIARQPEVPESSVDDPDTMRDRFHQLVGVCFWLLLIGMWAQLAGSHRVSVASIVDSIQYVAAIGGAVLALTLYWIRHNVAIHRRKGPRAAGPLHAPRVDADRLERPLRWALPGGHAAALGEAHLVVDVENGTKVYRLP